MGNANARSLAAPLLQQFQHEKDSFEKLMKDSGCKWKVKLESGLRNRAEKWINQNRRCKRIVRTDETHAFYSYAREIFRFTHRTETIKWYEFKLFGFDAEPRIILSQWWNS